MRSESTNASGQPSDAKEIFAGRLGHGHAPRPNDGDAGAGARGAGA
jgi:hypothetical protein